jgi:hypothetical protein
MRGKTGSNFCVSSAIIRTIKQACTLGQPSNLPLCVYRGRGGKLAYLTANAITKFLCKIAKKVHHGISKPDLDKISSHSLRVWVACLLHEAGQSGDYIKKRLRWPRGTASARKICPFHPFFQGRSPFPASPHPFLTFFHTLFSATSSHLCDVKNGHPFSRAASPISPI